MRVHVVAVSPDGLAHRMPWVEATTLCGEPILEDWQPGLLLPVSCPVCQAAMGAAAALMTGPAEPRYPKWHRLWAD